jgi:hypothetical protein
MKNLFLHILIAASLTLMSLVFIRFGGFFAVSLLIIVPMPLLLMGLMNGILPASLGMSLVALTLSIFLPQSTLVYVFAFALPSLVLIFLVFTGSIGRLALLFPFFMAVTTSLFILYAFGFEASALNTQLSNDLDKIFATPMGAEYADLKSFLIAALPPSTLFFWTAMLLISFYLANRVVKRLVQIPTPDLATLRLPRLASALLGLAFLISYLSPSVFINLFIAAFSLSFILQALAVLHFIARGKAWRLPFLVLFYALSLSVLSGVSQLALILFGLADVIFNFRNLKDK